MQSCHEDESATGASKQEQLSLGQNDETMAMDVDGEDKAPDPVVQKAEAMSLEDLSGVFFFDKGSELADGVSLRVGAARRLVFLVDCPTSRTKQVIDCILEVTS